MCLNLIFLSRFGIIFLIIMSINPCLTLKKNFSDCNVMWTWINDFLLDHNLGWTRKADILPPFLPNFCLSVAYIFVGNNQNMNLLTNWFIFIRLFLYIHFNFVQVSPKCVDISLFLSFFVEHKEEIEEINENMGEFKNISM